MFTGSNILPVCDKAYLTNKGYKWKKEEIEMPNFVLFSLIFYRTDVSRKNLVQRDKYVIMEIMVIRKN